MLDWDAVQLRQYCHDRHQTIDDKPFGGGGGMVMKAQPLIDALAEAKLKLPGAKAGSTWRAPRGPRLNQAKVKCAGRSSPD